MSRAGGSFTAPAIARYESVSAFMDDFRARGATVRENSDWSGETPAEILDSLANGDTKAVPAAEAVLDKINARLDLSGIAPRWGRTVVGAFPDVPAFLGGAPECMIRREPGSAPRGAINVYYCPMTSGSTAHERSFTYGVSVLAAVMALSRVRPVNVYYYTVCGIGDHVIRLRTDPMVLSEAAYILTSTAFYRSVSYSYAENLGWDGAWGNWACVGVSNSEGRNLPREKKIAHMKGILGLGDDDIIIPAMDVESIRAMGDPVKWINGLLDKYRGE